LKKERVKADYKAVVRDIFSPRRTKAYLFSGAILSVMSLFTTLTVYYLALASVSLILAGTTLLVNH